VTDFLPVLHAHAAGAEDGPRTAALPPVGALCVALVTAPPEAGAALSAVVLGAVTLSGAALPGHGGGAPSAAALRAGAFAWAAPDGTRFAYDPEGGVEVSSPRNVHVESADRLTFGDRDSAVPVALWPAVRARFERLETAFKLHVAKPPTGGHPDPQAPTYLPAPHPDGESKHTSST
jgi:hypothetical protein